MSKAAGRAARILFDPSGKYTRKEPPVRGVEDTGVRLKNPVHLDDGVRLSGFTDQNQNVFFGYDKNGELLTIRADRVEPERIVSSRDNNSTAEIVKDGLRRRLEIGAAGGVAAMGTATAQEGTMALTPEEMAAQAQRAVELGATPEEVESAVAHGTSDVRDAVSTAVRLDYTSPPMRMELPPSPAPRRSPVVAAHTGVVAAVIEGSEVNAWAHEKQSEERGPSLTLQRVALQHQNEYGARAAEQLDLSPEGISAARAVLTDPGAAFTSAMIDSIMKLKQLPGEVDNPNDTALRVNADKEWPLILRAAYPDTSGLETAKLRLFYDLDLSGKMTGPSDPLAAMGTKSEVATSLGWDAIPGKLGLELFNWSKTALEAGLISSAEHQVGTTFHGNVNDRIKRHFAGLPAHEQGPFLTSFMQAFVNQFGTAATPFSVYLFAEGIVPDHFIQSMQPTDRIQFVMDNIIGAMATMEVAMAATIVAAPVANVVGSIGRWAKGAVPGFRSFGQTMMRSRPKHYQQTVSALVNNMNAADFAKKWGIDKIDVVTTQLPKGKVEELLDNIPDEILNTPGMSPERIDEVLNHVVDNVRRQARNVFTTEERTFLVSDLMDAQRNVHKAAYRPSLSRVEVMDSDLGVTFYNTVGKDSATGFASLAEAVEIGQKHADFPDLSFFRVSADNKIVPYKPKVVKDADGHWTAAPGQDGEFFFQYKNTHFFSPLDNVLFGGDPVIAGSALDRILPGSLRWAGFPSTYLHPDLWKKYASAYVRETSLANALDMITAPMFKELRPGELRHVSDILRWAEAFGRKAPDGELIPRNPRITDIKEAFPEATPRMIDGYYQSRLFFDSVYQFAENEPLYRALHNQGFKSLSSPTAHYPGIPLTAEKAAALAKSRGNLLVLDAKTQETVTLSPEAVEATFKKRGSIIELSEHMKADSKSGQTHRLIMGKYEDGFRLGELTRYPLRYIPGYFTRMTKDPHYLRLTKPGKVDGVEEPISSIWGVATTRREVDRARKLLIDQEGRSLFPKTWNAALPEGEKIRLLKSKGVAVDVLEDKRIASIDKEALDLERFRSEGRLFFGDRNEEPVKTIYHGLDPSKGAPDAELIDPINTMHRVARMAARHISFEDLIKQQKNQFFLHFEHRLPAVANNKRSSSKEMSAALLENLRSARGDDVPLASQAYNWWKHIQIFDGTMQGSRPFFRRQIIAAAEMFDYWVGHKVYSKLGLKRSKTLDDMARFAHNFDPVEKWKSLGFLYFITSMPGRQLLLQGGQHLSLQAIDPLYFGKWQMDTFSLLLAVKRVGRGMEGSDLDKLKRSQLANQLGYSEEEYNILVDEMNRSGLITTVDLHTFAGGKPKTDVTIAETRAGQAFKSTGAIARTPLEVMRHYGFDLGEQYNVTASWLMALRRHKVENNITSLKQMSTDDWDAVLSRGSGYAMAMHRANMSAWQHGWLAAPLQFVQFSHKWFLTMLRADPTGVADKLGLTNRNFTKPEAAKIAIGQAIMFGGAGFGAKDLIRTHLNRKMEDLDLEPLSEGALDLVASGVIDYAGDKIVQAITGDPDINLAIDESFSPMGFPRTVRMWGDAAWGNRWAELLGGPGGSAASSLVHAVKMVRKLSGGEIEGMSELEKAELIIASAASGFLASASNYLKVRLAMRTAEWATNPQWTDRQGIGLGPNLEVTMAELVAKGLIGINPQPLLDHYTLREAHRNREQNIRTDAREAAQLLARAHALGTGTVEGINLMLSAINVEQTHLALLSDNERDSFEYLDEFRSQILSIKVDGAPLFDKIMESVNVHGDTPDMLYFLRNSPLATPEQKAAVAEALAEAVELRPERIQERMDELERQKESLKELRRIKKQRNSKQ